MGSVIMADCALSCLDSFTNITHCARNDLTCLCALDNLDDVIVPIVSCFQQSCKVKDTLTSTNLLYQACDVQTNTHQPEIIAITAVFGVLSLLFVGLRLIERQHFVRVFQLDDLFIILSEILYLGLLACISTEVSWGYGLDVWAVPMENFIPERELNLAAQAIYPLAISTTKLSMLAIYQRVFRDQKFRKIVWGIMVFCGCFGIAFMLLIILECHPASFKWEHWDEQGECINITLITWICAGINITLDIIVILLPIPQVLKLQLNWKKKAQLIGMFGLGFFITIVSCVRLSTNVQYSESRDFTYDTVQQSIWTNIEVGTSIICACMPAISGLVRRKFTKFSGTRPETCEERTAKSEAATNGGNQTVTTEK